MSLQRDIARVAWFTPMPDGWGIPILWTGPAGGTKTGQHAGWAREFVSPYIHASPGAKGEAWFGATPVPGEWADGSTVLRFPSNERIKEMIALGRGLILVDEVRSAPTSTLTALLSIFQEREVGDDKLPPGVRVFGASNSAREAVNGRKLSAPAANRCCHIAWPDPDSDQMLSHAISVASKEMFLDTTPVDYSDYGQQADIEQRIREAYKAEFPAAASAVFSYTSRVKNSKGEPVLRDQPLLGSDAADGPWGSPRSWYNAACALFGYRQCLRLGVIRTPLDDNGRTMRESDQPVLRAIIEGFVGVGNGGAFLEWLVEQDIPDYARWLDGEVSVNFEHGHRDDRTFTTMRGAAAHILSLPKGADRLRRTRKFWSIARSVATNGGFELVSSAAALLAEDDPAAVIAERTAFTQEYSHRMKQAMQQASR